MLKRCQLCGKMFETSSNAQKICKDKHTLRCIICGEPFDVIRKYNIPKTCSKECQMKAMIMNRQKKKCPDHSIIQWHSDCVITDSTSSRNKYDNRDISDFYSDQNITAYHIFPWDNKDMISKMIAPHTVISADDCTVYKLNLSATNDFLNKNCYLGSCRGQLLCLGLVKDNEIYQVMTFGNPTYDKSHSIQIYRMCTKLGYKVDSGYDKLSHVASEFGIYNIIAYCDYAKSNGSEYESIGMKFVRKSPPRLIWSNDDQYISSSLVVSHKSKYRSKDELIADGWIPIYDCGRIVYSI